MASQLQNVKKRVKYSPESMANVIQAVRNGMAKHKASRMFGVPKTTLLDKLSGKVPEAPTRPGPKPVLTKAEEDTLVNFINMMASIGYPVTRKELLFEVKKIIDEDGRPTPFKDNVPGPDWYTGFKGRHPEILERIPQSLGHERACINFEMVQGWFDGLFAFLKAEVTQWESLIKNPRRIFNADESGFPLCVKSGKVLAQAGAKHVYQVVANNKQQITVMACFNTFGDYMPPFIVYPGQRFRETGIDAFPDALYAHSENGWMDQELFLSFLEKFNTFLEEKEIQKPVILYVDGHSTHMTAQVARFCAENKIILYCLLAHATHVMQACDIGFFSPMKSAWKACVKQWQLKNLGQSVSKHVFPGIFKEAWDTCATMPIASQAFKRSGLFPLDQDGIDKTKLGPSQIMRHTITTASAADNSTENQQSEKIDQTEQESENKENRNPDSTENNCIQIEQESGNRETRQPDETSKNTENDNTKEISVKSPQNSEKQWTHVVVADVHVSPLDSLGRRNENRVSTAFQSLQISQIKKKERKINSSKLPKALSGYQALKIFKEREEHKKKEEQRKKERMEIRVQNKIRKEQEKS